MIKKENDEYFHAKDRADWRRWLKKNHEKKNKVVLVKYKKHTGKSAVTNLEAMEEAICFGWIDTTVNRLDEERYSQCFVKRNKNARWSKNTLSYAKRLKEEGKMFPQGLRAYEDGLKKPTTDHNVPKDAPTPHDLKVALRKAGILKTFETLAPSFRHLLIVQYVRAKRPETKQKRVAEIIAQVKKRKSA